MIEELKRLVKHSGIYGVGVLLSKCVGFLMIPVYTRFLAPADYGLLELLDLITFFAGIFAAMGIHSAVFRFYSAYEKEEDKREVISTALLYYCGASVALMAVMMAAAGPIAQVVLGSSAHAHLVRLVSITLLFSNLAEVPQAYWRVRERTVLFSVVGLLRAVVGAGLLALALAGLKWGVLGALYANLATSVLFGTAMFAATLRQVPLRVVGDKLRAMLAYGAPLIVQSIGSFVLVFSDRFFLRHFSDLDQVGVYSLGYKLASIVSIVVSGPFAFVWQWQQFELAKREDGKQIQAKIQTYQVVVSLLLGLGVALFARDALRIIAPASYWGAAAVVPLIVLSYVLNDIRTVVLSGVLVQKVTHYLAWIAAVVALANLALNYVLIPGWLAMGAAVATVLSYALSLVLCYVAAQRVYHVDYEYGRNALALGGAAVVYMVSTRVDLSLLPSLGVNAALWLAYLAGMYLMFSREERAIFRTLGAKIAERVPGRRPAMEEAHTASGSR